MAPHNLTVILGGKCVANIHIYPALALFLSFEIDWLYEYLPSHHWAGYTIAT